MKQLRFALVYGAKVSYPKTKYSDLTGLDLLDAMNELKKELNLVYLRTNTEGYWQLTQSHLLDVDYSEAETAVLAEEWLMAETEDICLNCGSEGSSYNPEHNHCDVCDEDDK